MSVVFTGYHDEAIITLVHRYFIFFGKRKVSYRGSGTVWHNADTGKRAYTFIESQLCDIWEKARWEQRYSRNGKRGR